jgi:hypothetical protein
MVPQVILKVFIFMLDENVFQNPELFPTQVSLYPEHSTLAPPGKRNYHKCSIFIFCSLWEKLNFVGCSLCRNFVFPIV